VSQDAADNRYKESAAIVARFLDIYRYLHRSSQAIASEFGVSGRQLSALRYLRRFAGSTIGELSDYLHISDSSTSELVAKLEEKGLATRTRCQQDNRVVRVSLTEAGQDLAARAPLAGIGLMRARVETLSPQEMADIAQAIERLASLLDVDEVSF